MKEVEQLKAWLESLDDQTIVPGILEAVDAIFESENPDYTTSPLENAIDSGNLDAVVKLINEGTPVTQADLGRANWEVNWNDYPENPEGQYAEIEEYLRSQANKIDLYWADKDIAEIRSDYESHAPSAENEPEEGIPFSEH